MLLNRKSLQIFQNTLTRSTALFLLSAGIAQTAFADQLPLVTGAEYDGSIISWHPLATATGYNIYRDYRYVDTVTTGTEYFPNTAGEYRIAGFDGNGNFSPLQVIEADIVETTNIAIVDIVDDFVDYPANVRGTVYSSSAGEIFWDKDNSRRLEYTVSLNGVALGTITGSSFWIPSLLVNALNIVSVEASTPAGSVSEAFTLAFDTRGGLYPEPAFFYDPFSERRIPAPENARIERYSLTTAELFWDRALASDGVVGTEVYRNYELIGTTVDNSFYDDTRSPGSLYTYELVAVGGNGELSVPTTIDPGPFNNTDEGIVSTLLAGISEVTTANPHIEWFPLFQSISFDVLPDDVKEVSTQNINNDGVVRTVSEYECDDGALTVERTTGYRSVTTMEFDECSIDRVFFEGGVNIVSEGGLYESVDYIDVLIGDVTFSVLNGNVTTTRTRATGARYLSYNSFEYEIIGNLSDPLGFDTLVVLEQSVAFETNYPESPSTFDTFFSVSAPWTQGRFMTVYTTDTFSTSASNEGNYITGALIAELDNGDNLTLSADTGNVDTWYAEISDMDGTRGFNGVWGDPVTLPCILLNEECQ